MKIEILALLDLIEALIKEDKLEKLENDSIIDLMDQYKHSEIVSMIKDSLDEEEYDQASHIIETYKVLSKEILTVFNSIQKDFSKLKHKSFKEDIAESLNEKYGISNVENVVDILKTKQEEVPRAIITMK